MNDSFSKGDYGFLLSFYSFLFCDFTFVSKYWIIIIDPLGIAIPAEGLSISSNSHTSLIKDLVFLVNQPIA
jgi:hypothetical protein